MSVPSERYSQLEMIRAAMPADRSPLDEAIEQARSRLLAMQDPAGYWAAELEADSTLTSEYIMLRYLLGKVDETKQRKAAATCAIRNCRMAAGISTMAGRAT